MKNKDLCILIFSSIIILLLTNCGEEKEPSINNLIGTWDYTQMNISACSNPNNNDLIDYSGTGDCEPNLGTDICTKISIEMDAENYSIITTTNTDGTENTAVTEQGTYSISSGSPYSTVMFCTDIVCRTETYIVSGTTLNIESTNPNNGCNVIITAEKR